MESNDWKEPLVEEVLASFYTPSNKIKELTRVGSEKDPIFMVNLIIYTRTYLHNHSLANLLAVHFAHQPSGKIYARELFVSLMKEPKDALEVLEKQLTLYGKPIPNGMKKAFATCFPTYSAASFQRTDQVGKVTYGDILRLCHPKAIDEAQNNLWRRLMHGEFPEEWEKETTGRGNKAQLIKTLQETLTKSPCLKGKTLFACDWTYAMTTPLPTDAAYPIIEYAKETMLKHANITEESLFVLYGEHVTVLPYEKGTTLTPSVFEKPYESVSNAGCVLDYLIHGNIFVDRLIVFADKRIYHQIEKKLTIYKEKVNPSVWLHIVQFTVGEDYLEKEENEQTLGVWRDDLISAMHCVEHVAKEIVQQLEA